MTTSTPCSVAFLTAMLCGSSGSGFPPPRLKLMMSRLLLTAYSMPRMMSSSNPEPVSVQDLDVVDLDSRGNAGEFLPRSSPDPAMIPRRGCRGRTGRTRRPSPCQTRSSCSRRCNREIRVHRVRTALVESNPGVQHANFDGAEVSPCTSDWLRADHGVPPVRHLARADARGGVDPAARLTSSELDGNVCVLARAERDGVDSDSRVPMVVRAHCAEIPGMIENRCLSTKPEPAMARKNALLSSLYVPASNVMITGTTSSDCLLGWIAARWDRCGGFLAHYCSMYHAPSSDAP